MARLIYNKYDKSWINQLPIVRFPGRIIVVLTAGETKKAVEYLLSQPLLGLDTETRPNFLRGGMREVALLQVSTPDTCFLFRLNLTGITDDLVRLLEDTTVVKVGLSWHDDIRQLKRRRDFKPGLFVDIQKIVGGIGIEDMALAKLYANIFGQKISKRQQLSNWEAPVLLPKQKLYAATDAWACINLYNEVMRLKATGDYELVMKPEPAEASAKEKEEKK